MHFNTKFNHKVNYSVIKRYFTHSFLELSSIKLKLVFLAFCNELKQAQYFYGLI